MSVESRANYAARRKRLATGLALFFRSERIQDPETDGLSDFEEKISQGYGGVIIIKHSSLKDPPQAIRDIIFSSPVLVQKEAVVLNALHQLYPGMPWLGRVLDVKIDPIVTDRTVARAIKKRKPVPKLHEGWPEFVHDALDYLKRGQLVVIAPEGTRRPDLKPYGQNTIATLLGSAHLARADVAVLFVDLRVAGRSVGYWDKSGLNLLKKYEVRIGRCLTGDEIIAMADGKLRDIDKNVVLAEMRRTAAIERPSRG